MWPFDRKAQPDVLRVGRQWVERWVAEKGVLTLQAQQPLGPGRMPDSGDLVAALRALYPNPAGREVDVVLESAWVPVFLLDLGIQATLSRTQIELLLRHRLDAVYGVSVPGHASLSGWILRVDYRAGARFALGYGFPTELHHRLLAIAKDLGLRWTSFTPSLAWGIQRLRPHRTWLRGTGWWVWSEQDRMLVAGLQSGGVVALNAGLTVVDTSAHIVQAIRIECARMGQDNSTTAPVAAASWRSSNLPRSTSQVHWMSVSVPAPKLTSQQVASVGTAGLE